jgi:hypothetical protein
MPMPLTNKEFSDHASVMTDEYSQWLCVGVSRFGSPTTQNCEKTRALQHQLSYATLPRDDVLIWTECQEVRRQRAKSKSYYKFGPFY